VRYLSLHGFTGTPETFVGLEAPPGSSAPSLAGHLQTAGTPTFEAEVERLAALGSNAEGLLGYSLGGRLALGILARYPRRFRHAVIISAHPGLTDESERTARRAADFEHVRRLREQGLRAFVDAWEALPLWATQASVPEAVRQQQREQRLRHSAEGLAQSLLGQGLAEMPDLRQALTSVSCRVDVLAGEGDPKFAELARELARVLPQVRLHLASGAGHNLLLERPELCRQLLVRGESP
jgi:2-succinyl-6-hydroxy-2,4-cyclohexadiene-1-carboxylate synthase